MLIGFFHFPREIWRDPTSTGVYAGVINKGEELLVGVRTSSVFHASVSSHASLSDML